MKTKIIANYLPQFHSIPQNDQWWGKGYTDWEAVKKCKPQFKGHNQPRIPLNSHYYALDQVEEIRRQVNLANEYGVYGFGIYHYWFSSKLKLLEKPAEILLNTKDINQHFILIWDNGSWKRTWSNVKNGFDWAPEFDNKNNEGHEGNGLLAELVYGDEKEWRIHFDYLLPFFKDERYIKIDGKPAFVFYQMENDYETIVQMTKKWDEWAKNEGLKGITFISRKNPSNLSLEYQFTYEPLARNTKKDLWTMRFKNVLNRFHPTLSLYDYDKVWKNIIKRATNCKNQKEFYGAFVGFDDCPRRGAKGKIIMNQTPEKFERYLKELVEISEQQNREYIFLTAWNEWGEGAYLEPDEENKYAYLEAIQNIVNRKGETYGK